MKTITVSAGDFHIDPDSGQLVWVEDGDKLIQDIAEVLLSRLHGGTPTEQFTTISQPGTVIPAVSIEYGSELHNLEDAGLPSVHMNSYISMKVSEAVNRLIKAQRSARLGVMPTTEEIKSFEVYVRPIPKSPMSFIFYLYVTTQDGSSQSVPEYRVDLSHILTANDILSTLVRGG